MPGRNGGTYACKDLVIAYAAWISPVFHLKVIRVFLENQNKQPDLATAAQALRHKRFYLSFDYEGKVTFHQMPDNPYDGLAKAITDPSNIGLEDQTIEEIGQACMTALAHRAKRRKELVGKLRKAAG